MDNTFYFKISMCLCLHFWSYQTQKIWQTLGKNLILSFINFWKKIDTYFKLVLNKLQRRGLSTQRLFRPAKPLKFQCHGHLIRPAEKTKTKWRPNKQIGWLSVRGLPIVEASFGIKPPCFVAKSLSLQIPNFWQSWAYPRRIFAIV